MTLNIKQQYHDFKRILLITYNVFDFYKDKLSQTSKKSHAEKLPPRFLVTYKFESTASVRLTFIVESKKQN